MQSNQIEPRLPHLELGAPIAEGTRKRNQTACEGCRTKKLRCMPSEEPGICQRCHASKQECVSRAKPRPQRSTEIWLASEAESRSAVFSLDFTTRGGQVDDANFDIFRDCYRDFLDKFFPDLLSIEPQSSASSFLDAMARRNPATISSTRARSIDDFQAKPTFNTASAQSLLQIFRSMLKGCPFIDLSTDATIVHLSASRPFLLLAILATASGACGSRSHSIYDDEFRRVLAFKFVTGCERNLELLQGVLVYCIWYPSHLKTPSKEIYYYMRIASDIARDLQLDRDRRVYCQGSEREITSGQVDCIRAYLALCYLESTYASPSPLTRTSDQPWMLNKLHSSVKSLFESRSDSYSISFTEWTAYCCDFLETRGDCAGDMVLHTLVRLASLFRRAWAVLKDTQSGMYTPSHARAFLSELSIQLQAQEVDLYPSCRTTPVLLQSLFVTIVIEGGGLLLLLNSPPQNPLACLAAMKQFLDHVRILEEESLLHLTTADFFRMVLVVVAAIRLCFPLVDYAGYESVWIRAELNLGYFLDQMADRAAPHPHAKKRDVVAMMEVLMGVLREKYRMSQAQFAASRQMHRSAVSPPRRGSNDRRSLHWSADYVAYMSSLPLDPMQGQSLHMADAAALMPEWWRSGPGTAWGDQIEGYTLQQESGVAQQHRHRAICDLGALQVEAEFQGRNLCGG